MAAQQWVKITTLHQNVQTKSGERSLCLTLVQVLYGLCIKQIPNNVVRAYSETQPPHPDPV